MSERNKRDKFSDNRNDLFADFDKENSDIDGFLKDAFSFMNTGDEEEKSGNKSRYNDSLSLYQEYPRKEKDPKNGKEKKNNYDRAVAGDNKLKKIIYSILIAILSICIVLVSGVLVAFHKTAKNIYFEGEAINPDMSLAPEANFETMYGVGDASSLNAYLKEWANNGGEIMDSDNVINILLIGQDGDGSEKSNGRADSLIVASINKATKTITLCSVMRDSYIYMNFNNKDRYDKINTACVAGGQKGVVETIEKNYKIDIDYFVSVYFESFQHVIDALGGVNVPIDPKLASYINRTTRYNVSSGDSVKLSGAEALVYSRIRYLYSDGDVSRTANQRNVIMAIMNKMKGASFQEVYKAITAILPYIKTNMKEDAIVNYAKQALSNGWINYTVKQETFPTDNTRASASIKGMSCWVVDYPRAAQHMQKTIYGRTNIVIPSDSVNPLKQFLYLYQEPSYNDPTGSYITNESGETITQEGYTGEYITGENVSGEGATGEVTSPIDTPTSPPVEVTLPPVDVTDFQSPPQ